MLANGGTAKSVAGTWSATSELLAERLAPRHPEVVFAEVRYRVKSWHALESCMADTGATLDLTDSLGARQALLIGFSMGGAVSIGVAGHESVSGVLGLAPWIPDALDLGGLAGKRLDVVHGAWDRWLPGIPGVSPDSSRRGFRRAQALGVAGTYTLLARGLHGAAVRRRSGDLVPLPRWREWVDQVDAALIRFAADAAPA